MYTKHFFNNEHFVKHKVFIVKEMLRVHLKYSVM